ncbi:hypothetical protein [Roseovarius nitratireducens]|uniref:hypothetical protein n=1 Tax=Roseovarius nitratireducens TaxID=2044597 RepID=UPI000CE21E9F|nr:hypothetical protein [Roseovarius nitratireducens]
MNNRQQRDVERLTGRRRDTAQRAILWSELETLAQKLSGMLRTQKAAKVIAEQLDGTSLSETAINRSNAIREVNQLIDSTNEFIANEAARLDASDQAIIDTNIAAVEVRLDDAEVAVQDEITARTDGDTALGQQITTVEANLAAAEANVTQNASAIATIEGFQAATYSLRVDAGDAEGSLELVAADDPINGPASAVRIRADNILLDGTVLAHHIDVASLAADVGFIGELTTNTAFIGDLTAQTAFIQDIQAIDISADRITSGKVGTDFIDFDGTSLSKDPVTGYLQVAVEGIQTFNIKPQEVTTGGFSANGSDFNFTGVAGAKAMIWAAAQEINGDPNGEAEIRLNGTTLVTIPVPPSTVVSFFAFSNPSGAGSVTSGSNTVSLFISGGSVEKRNLMALQAKV